eukprot:6517022-Pyramimonas_sp.AAC.1
MSGLVETLFGHLPAGFRSAKAAQFQSVVDLLGDLSAAGLQFQRGEEGRQRQAAEAAAQRAAAGEAGDVDATPTAIDSR